MRKRDYARCRINRTPETPRGARTGSPERLSLRPYTHSNAETMPGSRRGAGSLLELLHAEPSQGFGAVRLGCVGKRPAILWMASPLVTATC